MNQTEENRQENNEEINEPKIDISSFLLNNMNERKVPMAHPAAKAGLVLGVSVSATRILASLFADSSFLPVIFNILQIIIFVIILQAALRVRVIKRSVPIIGFVEAWGYTVLISSFAGIIVGVFEYIIFKYIAYETYQQFFNIYMNTVLQGSYDNNMITFATKMWNSPLIWFFSGIINTILGGAFIGLLVSAINRRNPLMNKR